MKKNIHYYRAATIKQGENETIDHIFVTNRDLNNKRKKEKYTLRFMMLKDAFINGVLRNALILSFKMVKKANLGLMYNIIREVFHFWPLHLVYTIFSS